METLLELLECLDGAIHALASERRSQVQRQAGNHSSR